MNKRLKPAGRLDLTLLGISDTRQTLESLDTVKLLLMLRPYPPSARPSARPSTAHLFAWLLLGCAALTGCSNTGFSYNEMHEGLWGSPAPLSESEAVEMAFDKQSTDRKRRGLAWLASEDYGDAPEYLAAYRLFAIDPDGGVRSAVAKALGEHGTTQDAGLLATLLRDTDPLVRWQAAEALRKIHNPEVVPALIQRLDPEVEEDTDTRAAAALALGQYPDRVVLSGLITALNQSSYQVVHAAHYSLTILTGHDEGIDPRKWANWASENPDAFANRRAYTYGVYDPTLTYWDKYVTFWNNPDTAKREPVGIK